MFYNGGARPPPNFHGGSFRHPPPSGRGGFGPPQRGGFYDNSFRGHNIHGPPRPGFQHNGENKYRNNGDNNYQNRQNVQNQNKPWITQDIRVAISCRNQLAQKARQSKAGEDFDALRVQKQRVEVMIEESKMKYFRENPEREEEWLHVLAKESFTSATWCDVCEKGFESVHKLKEHSAEHATCGVDGCSYTAHESLLEKHVRHQHLSGLFQKIPQGQSKEDIEKWRAERRKNFPTRDKVATKDAAREEARERGEVLRLQKIINKYTGVKDDSASEDGKENRYGRDRQPEPDWECNCKARFMLNGNNTRGRGGWRNRNHHVNIKRLKHQSHCQELVRIRERIKASNEEKAKIRLEKAQAAHEKKLKDKEEKGEKGDANETDVNERNADPSRIPVEALDNIEDSDSEPEGMCGTLPMFSGIGKTVFHNSLSVFDGESRSADNPFHISDDEDDFSPGKEESFHISDDDDDKTIDTAQDIPISDEEGSDNECIDFDNSNVAEGKDGIISHDENEPPTEVKMVKQILNEIPAVQNDDSDDEPPEEITINKTDTNSFPTDENKEKEEKDKSTSKTDTDMPRFQTRKRKHKGDANTEPDTSQTKDNKKKVKSVLAQRIAPPTLLEKLLSDEILHERNVILQCVRYVCKNNFFQPQEEKDNTS